MINHPKAAEIPAPKKVRREKMKTATRTGIQKQKCFDIVVSCSCRGGFARWEAFKESSKGRQTEAGKKMKNPLRREGGGGTS